jgi:hypothetical protein
MFGYYSGWVLVKEVVTLVAQGRFHWPKYTYVQWLSNMTGMENKQVYSYLFGKLYDINCHMSREVN